MAVNPWRTFARNHPKAAKWVWQIGVFYLFSLAVTVLQYALFTFLPYLFGEGLASTAFMWPHIPISFAGIDYSWNVLGYGVARNAAGEVVIGGGLGYFLSYEIRSFVAQCVNFPMQRNITFKSKGNIWYQALWYLLAFIVITCIVNSINCIWVAVAGLLVPDFIYNIGTTVLNGGISMVIFFFVNKIIFPEGEKAAK